MRLVLEKEGGGRMTPWNMVYITHLKHQNV